MFKIFRNLFLLGATVFLISTGLLFISYNSNNYMVAGSDKYRLLYSIQQPKIILVGGSNVAFSLDSAKIEKRFHMPVVNMGLAAGLGLKFMINEIEQALKTGDIVIIIPEYEQFYALPLEGRPIDLGAASKYCPECFLTSNVANDPQQLALTAAGIFQGIEGDLLAKIEPQDKIYARQGFDQHGDMVAHLGQTEKHAILNHIVPIKPQAINPAIDFLNSTQQSLSGKNIQIFLAFPAIPEKEYFKQKKNFPILYDLLRAKLEMPILGAPSDFIYPVEMFYDTVYHMNKFGRSQRTDRLIELLAAVLKN